MIKRCGLLGVALGLLTALEVHGQATTIVHQAGRAFTVASVQIARGDTVQFNNDDTFDHQLYIDSPTFKYNSPGQPPGATTSVAFPTAGTFDVRCEIHPRMHLSVTVQ